jgi:hypothetical protein
LGCDQRRDSDHWDDRLDDLRSQEGSEMIQALAIGGAIISIIGVFAGVIWLAERKGASELREEQRDEELRRLQDTIEADVRARERIARGELLQNDGHRRD